jgi:hypothetical protein
MGSAEVLTAEHLRRVLDVVLSGSRLCRHGEEAEFGVTTPARSAPQSLLSPTIMVSISLVMRADSKMLQAPSQSPA